MRTLRGLAIAVVIVLTGISIAQGAAFTSTQDGDWDNTNTWGGAGTPGADDTVTITNNVDLAQAESCSNLTIGAGGTLDCQGTNFTASGSVIISGTLDAHTSGEANVILGSVVPVGTVTINSGGVINAPGSTGSLTIGGTFDNNNGASGYVHNNGTLSLEPVTFRIYAYMGNATFYNIVMTSDEYEVRFWTDDFTVVNLLDWSAGYVVYLYSGITITIGSSSQQGEIKAAGTTSFYIGEAGFTVQAADPAYPAKLGGLTVNFIRGKCNYTLKDIEFTSDATTTAYEPDPAPVVTVEGTVSFMGYKVAWPDDTLAIGTNNAIFRGDFTNEGTNTLTSGTMTCGGNFTNNGVFNCGTSTVIFTNTANVNVDNNGQAFYNLTVNAAAGTTNTLVAGQVSAISNLLHVMSGTCHTDDNLSKYYTGGGTFVPLTSGANIIPCGARPQVEPGATLEAGCPPAGAVFRIW